MSEQEIIASFMSLKRDRYGWFNTENTPTKLQEIISREIRDEAWYVDYLRFNESWDWLIPVIEKILNFCQCEDEMDRYYEIIDQIPSIEDCFESIIEFIKWYNQEYKKDEKDKS